MNNVSFNGTQIRIVKRVQKGLYKSEDRFCQAKGQVSICVTDYCQSGIFNVRLIQLRIDGRRQVFQRSLIEARAVYMLNYSSHARRSHASIDKIRQKRSFLIIVHV